MKNPPILDYIISAPECLLERDFLISLICKVEFPKAVDEKGDLYLLDIPYAYAGKVFIHENTLQIATDVEEVGDRKFKINSFIPGGDVPDEFLVRWDDPIQLKAGDLQNLDHDLVTIVGRYILNYAVIDSVVGEKIPFIDDIIMPKAVSDKYVALRLSNKIDNNDIHKYVDNAYFIGSMTELAVPTFSRKSTTSFPEVYALKKKLLEEYKDKLDDPKVMIMIEDAIIAEHKKHLKDDPSMGFLMKDGKSFDVHLKMMYGLGGITEEFGSPGKYVFSQNSLEEGWRREDYVNLVNETRRGIYLRGTQTMEGGTWTNKILRVFQNIKIVEQDCGTQRTFEVYLAKEISNDFMYRYIVNPDGSYTTLTPDNISQYIDTTVHIRTVQQCGSKEGYCFTCAGALFKELNQESVTTSETIVTSTFLLLSMKAMHGGKVSTRKITSLDPFVV